MKCLMSLTSFGMVGSGCGGRLGVEPAYIADLEIFDVVDVASRKSWQCGGGGGALADFVDLNFLRPLDSEGSSFSSFNYLGIPRSRYWFGSQVLASFTVFVRKN
jgi:hypothetical protein